MTFNEDHIKALVEAHIHGALDNDGQQMLRVWLSRSPNNQAWFDVITSDVGLADALQRYNSYDTEKMWRRLYGDAKHEAPPVVPLYKRRKTWYLVAASLVLLLAVRGLYTYFHVEKQTLAGVIPDASGRFKNDVAPPKGKQATLVLADGSSILLDSAADGRLARQGGTSVLKSNGQLVYETNGKAGMPSMAYNTVSTSRGSLYQVVLPDGSKVWLDAASSLRFPTAFSGAERKVFLTGQAYFEVVKNTEKPFKVSLPSIAGRGGESGEVEVLGTHFNINAYNDEQNIKTTLLEGAVRVTPAMPNPLAVKPTVLSPHEQAVLALSGGIKVTSDADIDAAMAWKNGLFRFTGDAPLEVIMARVARWYDVEVVFKDKVSYPFVATVRRDLPLSELLKLLEMTKLVRFEIQGKTVLVMKGE